MRAELAVRRRLAWVSAGVVLAVLVLRFWPPMTVLDRIELRSVDWRFAQRGPRAPDPRIVLVHVDEGSIAQLGRWPWPRRRFAELIRVLADLGVAAIVFDIFFADPDASPGGPDSDADLVRATAQAGMVYHAAFGYPSGAAAGHAGAEGLAGQAWSDARVEHGRGLNAVARLYEVGEVTPLLPGLAEAAAGVGFVNVADSGDGVYRHTLPAVRHAGKIYPSLTLAAAAGPLGVPASRVVIRPGREIDLGGERSIPIDRNGRMLIDFAGGAGTFPYVSVRDLLALAANDPQASRQRFAGKVVLVAVSAPGLYDLRACPFDTVYNGAETQANALANMLEGRFLRQAPGEVCLLTVLVAGLVVFQALSRLRPSFAATVGIALLLAYNWLCLALFARGLLLEMVAPNLVMVGCTLAAFALRLMGEESEHDRVWTALTRFAPAAVVERAVEENAGALLRGQRRVVSVMFADLRDFTAKSERMPPDQTVDLLNRFFALVHETIWEFEGTLDKYMGDGMMAFWNAPAEQPEHALMAVRAAVHIQRRIRYNRAEWAF
ncbi:MAG: CHASE2 domain-containing protein, partial [Armatimonadota bacterium]